MFSLVDYGYKYQSIADSYHTIRIAVWFIQNAVVDQVP